MHGQVAGHPFDLPGLLLLHPGIFLPPAHGANWSFTRAYSIALAFVAAEYIFNVIGNKGANQYITVFQIMLLIIVFDIINLFILNWFLLKNPVRPLRDGISLALVVAAVAVSTSKSM